METEKNMDDQNMGGDNSERTSNQNMLTIDPLALHVTNLKLICRYMYTHIIHLSLGVLGILRLC